MSAPDRRRTGRCYLEALRVNTGCDVAGRPWNVRLAEVVSGRCVGMDTGSPDNSRKAHTMAQQTMVTRTDDIDGSRNAEPVSFGLDGKVYEIDLGRKNAAALRK